MSARPVQIAVIGAGHCDEGVARVAERVGAEIARRGGRLLCGGGGGVMAAAAAGARAAGGPTVGILPGRSASESPPDPNLDTTIFTGIGQARNLVLVLSADAVVGVGGGWGTLSEIGHALKEGKPVVLVGSWRLERPDGRPEPLLTNAETPSEAVERAFAACGAGSEVTA